MRTQRPRLSRSRGRLHTLALLTFATAATAGLSSTATAAVTGTSITSPTAHQVVDLDLGHFDLNAGFPTESPELPTTRVTGTATTDGSSPSLVQAVVVLPLKLLGSGFPLGISEPVEVAAGGSFSADVMTPPINSRIVVVPSTGDEFPGEEFTLATEAVRNGIGAFPSTPVLGGATVGAEIPGLGNISLALRGQRQGLGLIGPAGLASIELPSGITPLPGSSLSIGALGGVTAGPLGAEGELGLAFMGASGISNAYNDARGGLTVDGTRAYLRDHIPVGSDVLPAPTRKRTVDTQTGGQTVTQTQSVYVAVNPAEDPDNLPLEDGYKASGLELQRTTVQDHDGRQVSVTDRFVSTDGKTHRIDVLYAEGLTILSYDARSPFQLCGLAPCEEEDQGPFDGGFNPFATTSPIGDGNGGLSPLEASDEPEFPEFEMPAFRIPWETGGAWEGRSHAEPLTAPSTATSTVYNRVPHAMHLVAAFLNVMGGGEAELPAKVPSVYGATTFGTRPDAGLFVADPIGIGMLLGGTSTQYVSRFVRDVPAGGNTTIAQVYSTGTTQAEVEALAAAAEKRLAPAAPAPAPTPVAPPAPPAPPAAPRKAPKKLSATSKLQRTKSGQYRFRFTGQLTLPKGVAKSACRAGGGTVAVQVKAGANTISTRRVKLDRNCKYAVRINFRSRARFGNRTRLTVIAKWSGNRALGPKPAKRFTVKVR